MPSMTPPANTIPDASALLSVQNLKMWFPGKRVGGLLGAVSWVKAVDGVSFDVRQGETLGVVGESGSGKTTMGRSVVQLYRPSDGRIVYNGVDLTQLDRKRLGNTRRDLQMIFQDPYASLNPRMTIGAIIEEPITIHKLHAGADKTRRVKELLEVVGLASTLADRYPHEISGGQRQRVGIARALALNPKIIICDEPVSALDVSIQAQVVNLLKSLQREFGLTYLFIAHDLSVVRHISDRVAVMYLGRIVEIGDREDVYARALHPYTQALISAVPVPDPAVERTRKRIALVGDIPSPDKQPSGCHFHPRCAFAQDRCRAEAPPLVEAHPGHQVACHFWETIGLSKKRI